MKPATKLVASVTPKAWSHAHFQVRVIPAPSGWRSVCSRPTNSAASASTAPPAWCSPPGTRMGNTMPPRDPNDDDDEEEEEDEDGEYKNQPDEPAVVREPDDDE
jgi:hypothetical protein